MKDLQDILSKAEIHWVSKRKFPGFKTPMLATLTDDYFDDKNWIYERKLDGVRCLVTIENGKVSLYSRNHNEMSDVYPELTKALTESHYPNMILDGEVVAFEGKTTSFGKLQRRIQLTDKEKIRTSKVKVYLYLFDITYYREYSLEEAPLKVRKKLLKSVVDWQPPLRYTVHKNEKGTEFLEQACKKGWEGLIAKKADSTYVHTRNKNWLKFKCSKGQELVIGGFTSPQGSRVGFGALLVGFYQGEKLRYAGKVGTGFDDEFLSAWRKKFDQIISDESPFYDYKDSKNGTNHWLKPKYVGQFGFTEWTKTNKLRHPRFLGMRDDKNPTDVVKENAS